MFLFLFFSLQMVWRPSSSMVWPWTHWPWNGAGSRTQVSTMHCRLLNQAWSQAISISWESPMESFKLSFNTLCPSDAIWHHRPESALAQVMAWCCQAPSHYLNQCWLPFGEVLRHLPGSNFTGSAQATILYNELENLLKPNDARIFVNLLRTRQFLSFKKQSFHLYSMTKMLSQEHFS